jgi:hypothetical protein
MIIGMLGLVVLGLFANLWFYEYRVAKEPKKVTEISLIGWKNDCG